MATAENIIVFGTFTSDALPRNLDLGFVPHYFHMWNQTQQDATDTPGRVKEAWWMQGMADSAAFTIQNTDGAATNQSEFITAGGFVPRAGLEEVLSAAQTTAGAITQANPARVTLTAHGFNTADVVRLTGTTVMLQASGMDYTITRIDANTFDLDNLDATGFAAAATAASARQVIVPRGYNPRRRSVLNISQAAAAVVTTSEDHGYNLGDRIRFRVPRITAAIWGMIEIDELIGVITATTAGTFTVDINSTGFTAFSFVTSAQAAAGARYPDCVPVGENAEDLDSAVNNAAFAGIRIGGLGDGNADNLVGANNDIIRFRAERFPIIL